MQLKLSNHGYINKLSYSVTGVSFLYLSIETPAKKNTNPNIVIAQGLKVTKLFPKIPKTPSINPTIPAMVNMNANMRIIICVFIIPIKFINSMFWIFKV